jgi:diguanylate cyclase (GGDEF)-like protein
MIVSGCLDCFETQTLTACGMTFLEFPAPDGGRSSAGGPIDRRPNAAGDSVMIVEIDQANAIRARHGSAACEQLAQAVAECLRRRLRGGDRVALLRDDEFLAILPGAPRHELAAIENRVRQAIDGLRLSIAGTEWRLSCTIGSASSSQLAESSRRLDSLVRLADTALQRNRARSITH